MKKITKITLIVLLLFSVFNAKAKGDEDILETLTMQTVLQNKTKFLEMEERINEELQKNNDKFLGDIKKALESIEKAENKEKRVSKDLWKEESKVLMETDTHIYVVKVVCSQPGYKGCQAVGNSIRKELLDQYNAESQVQKQDAIQIGNIKPSLPSLVFALSVLVYVLFSAYFAFMAGRNLFKGNPTMALADGIIWLIATAVMWQLVKSMGSSIGIHL